GCGGSFRRTLNVALLHTSGGFGDGDGLCSRGLDRFPAQVIRCSDPPCAICYDANTDAKRFGVRGAADLAVLRSQGAAALVNDAGVSVAGPAKRSSVQSPFSDVFHSGIQIYHRGREAIFLRVHSSFRQSSLTS